jgi:hypothetical protein
VSSLVVPWKRLLTVGIVQLLFTDSLTTDELLTLPRLAVRYKDTNVSEGTAVSIISPINGRGRPFRIVGTYLPTYIQGVYFLVYILSNKQVQNYWVFGLSPSSGILGNRKHDV